MKLVLAQSVRIDVDTCSTSRFELLKALSHRGWEVTLVAGLEKESSGIPSLPYRLVPIPQWKIPVLRQLHNIARVQLALWRLIIGRRIDRVILDPFLFPCGFPLDLASRLGLLKTQFFLDVRSGIFHRRANRLTKRA